MAWIFTAYTLTEKPSVGDPYYDFSGIQQGTIRSTTSSSRGVGIETNASYYLFRDTDLDRTTTGTTTTTTQVIKRDPNTLYNITDKESLDTDLSNITDNGKGVIDSRITDIMSTYVTDTYVNGNSGYRTWSDGYCEQWGQSSITHDKTVTVTLLKPYINTNYIVTTTSYYTGTSVSSTGNGPVNWLQTISTSTMLFYEDVKDCTIYWKTGGYIN